VAVDFEFSASLRAPIFRTRFDTKAADFVSAALPALMRAWSSRRVEDHDVFVIRAKS
jgi:hypothetical protein